MDGGSRKDGAIRKNCRQEICEFRNELGERMSHFGTEGDRLIPTPQQLGRGVIRGFLHDPPKRYISAICLHEGHAVILVTL
jgi:hypothetical protein